MKRIIYSCALAMLALLGARGAMAQGVSYNTTGAPAHASAMLDVQSTSKGVLAGLEKGNCLDVAILVTNTFILKNPNVVPLYYYLSNVKNGVMVGIEIEIKPNTSYVALFNEFEGASGLFLNVKNKTDYTVTWEVHID